MNTSRKFELNKIVYDDFARPSGILLMNKPEGISSHDLVDRVRAHLKTQKVGHAGALDIFSSGLMLILIGKATKMADELLNLDKAYKARVVFGLTNFTQDPEGEIIEFKADILPSKELLLSTLLSFKGEYLQYVSIYSSVKVNGVKLRKILRDHRYKFEVESKDEQKKIIIKHKESDIIYKTIEVPRRNVKIYEIDYIKSGKINGSELPFKGIDKDLSYGYLDIYVKCSKGTYIRQLALDIAEKLGTKAVLSELERTELGKLTSADALKDVSDIETYSAK